MVSIGNQSLMTLQKLPFFALLLAACGGGAAKPGGLDGGNCDPTMYPCPPYGYTVGSVVGDLTLSGRRDTDGNGSVLDDPLGPISLSDYYKDKNTHVLFISLATVWCAPCATEQPSLVQLYQSYRAAGQGVAFLEAVVQDSAGKPATSADADTWAMTYQIPFDMAFDPANALSPYYNPTSFPVQLVIKTSDMSLVYQHTSISTDLKSVIDGVLANP
jgi:thiol-disulfide isomerase/thioredoxin